MRMAELLPKWRNLYHLFSNSSLRILQKYRKDGSAADMFSCIGQNDGIGCINGKQQDKQKTQYGSQTDCHAVVKPVKNRLKKADKENAAKSKADSACKTDITVQVQQMSAVIPPADVPLPRKPDSGGVLE